MPDIFKRYCFILLLLLPIAPSATALAGSAAERPRNIIILFADGATVTQFEFGAYTARKLQGRDFALFDRLLPNGSLGLMSTFSNDAFVTDSAAAASAMSTGYKVNNGAVAVSPEGQALPPFLQLAKKAGKRIGIVTTAPVYDATPAAFAVSVPSRKDYTEIVDAYLALQPDVLMGGGRDMFLPAGITGSARKDARDLRKAFVLSGYGLVQSASDLGMMTAGKWLGLFALEDMAFEIDRQHHLEPSLSDMTRAALSALEGKQGFVLLVENESTDTAAHQNDAASLMHDLWAFDAALDAALDYQISHPDTLVIVTGDHETGGFSPTYVRKKSSEGKIADIKLDHSRLAQIGKIKHSINAFVQATENLKDDASGRADFDHLAGEYFPGIPFNTVDRTTVLNKQLLHEQTSYLPHNTLGQIIGKSTGIYWGTSGHTPEPALAAATGPGHAVFRGYYDNTDFAKKLHGLLHLIE